jgi:hypothetical protein
VTLPGIAMWLRESQPQASRYLQGFGATWTSQVNDLLADHGCQLP